MTDMVAYHAKWKITLGTGTVSHGVQVDTPSGAFVHATVDTYGRPPKWGVYTAGGELVYTYEKEDFGSALSHAQQLSGDQFEMGAWDGPYHVIKCERHPQMDQILHLYERILAHHDEVRANVDFDL